MSRGVCVACCERCTEDQSELSAGLRLKIKALEKENNELRVRINSLMEVEDEKV
jgi:hypothetical protein